MEVKFSTRVDLIRSALHNGDLKKASSLLREASRRLKNLSDAEEKAIWTGRLNHLRTIITSRLEIEAWGD